MVLLYNVVVVDVEVAGWYWFTATFC